MLENPYFGTLVSSLEFEVNNDIPTVSNQGDKFVYNDEYLDVLSLDEVTTLLANASMHQALFHTQRGQGKVGSVWRLASDYAINDLLVESGFALPPMVNYSSRFERLYAEQIYTVLLGELDLSEEPQESREQERELMQEELLSDEEYTLILEQLKNKLEQMGDLPRGLERFVEGVAEPKVSWRDELYRYVNAHAKSDYRMFPPSKKHLYRGIALPSIYGEELKIVVAIDTSASVDDELLELFWVELQEIMQVFTHYVIEFIECDAVIHNVQRLTPMKPFEPMLKGGGGTDFRPVFEHIELLNEDFKFLIYFTDGMGEFPPYVPMIDTLWVMPKMIETEMPFGEILCLV
jgi:predicted metal-dependent peptidase